MHDQTTFRKPPDETWTVLLIAGMRGNGCRETVAAALESVPGVKEAHVNLYRARASVIHNARCAAADLIAAVGRSGYRAGPESNGVSPKRLNAGTEAGKGPIPGMTKELPT